MVFKPYPPYIQALNLFSENNPPKYKERFEKLKRNLLLGNRKKTYSAILFMWKCKRGHEFKRTFQEMIFSDPTCPVCQTYKIKNSLFNKFKDKFEIKYLNSWKEFEGLNHENIYQEFEKLKELNRKAQKLRNIIKILKFFNKYN